MVVDGNEESKIVALWSVVNEDNTTISHVMDVFMKNNDTTKTKCIMADKEMTENNCTCKKDS